MAEIKNFTRICRKIIGVGRNYIDHAKELNNPVPKEPLLFLKAPSTFISEGKSIEIPSSCQSLHHEVELGVIIGEGGKNISEDNAFQHIAGYALALDMTARDFQDIVKKNGTPWLPAKCWDTFCPISEFIPKEKIPDPSNVDLWLKVDGELKQSASTKNMIFSLPQIISYTSKIMTLERGDVILTGTPEGVGPVTAGQILECGIQGIIEMKFGVENSPSDLQSRL